MPKSWQRFSTVKGTHEIGEALAGWFEDQGRLADAAPIIRDLGEAAEKAPTPAKP